MISTSSPIISHSRVLLIFPEYLFTGNLTFHPQIAVFFVFQTFSQISQRIRVIADALHLHCLRVADHLDQMVMFSTARNFAQLLVKQAKYLFILTARSAHLDFVFTILIIRIHAAIHMCAQNIHIIAVVSMAHIS